MVCGDSLLQADARASREERKVISVLFVDLVGFTAASEAADPEDVRARLQAYHGRAKTEVERFGGTIEKFVGDAVMAVFGAPVAHEDDAERSVRSGIAILSAVAELGLEARAAVNTGEAVVALDARPELGESIVTGDVVNTAARLQSAAPPGELVVGEQTYWSTRQAIEYDQLDHVQAKGKVAPVPLWLAVGARSRLGVDPEPWRPTPFVGRDDELEVLRQVYGRTLRESACHLLTIVGEPGIGKSRLVAELRAFVDAQDELIFWREGRCLPYGDGIALWALGEIVKAHAGILESDDPAIARQSLLETVEPLVPAKDRSWIVAELARLLGAGEPGGERDESFAAWRVFLEAIAAQRPLVLVVEDLHWADAALLEFLEYLADWSTSAPLLIVCTARPELYELHPTWGGGKRNATTISLSPLSGDNTSRLITALLERSVLEAELQQTLLERAGGNPLYAEQFVRMLEERPEDEVQIPETIQALIAARLDTLGAERKVLIQDAAVIGKVFWAGAVAAVGGSGEGVVRNGLHELVRRELVRPTRLSSMEGQSELAFGHSLVRDVAYAQIPRAERVRKHHAAARWIEEVAGDRVADHADVLAHHYREALRLARSAGLETAELEDGARRFLWAAAKRATALDVRRSDALFAEALELTPRGHPDRGRLLTASVELSGSAATANVEVLDEAIEELRSSGDELGLGKAMAIQAHELWRRGDSGEVGLPLLAAARELLEEHEPGPELAYVYSFCASTDVFLGRSQEALELAQKGLALAERLQLDDLMLRNRQWIGLARCDLGDRRGLEDLRESLERALELGLSSVAANGYSNYGSMVWLAVSPEAALEVYREGADFLPRRGLTYEATWQRAELTKILFDLGRWDELLVAGREVEERTKDQPLLVALMTRALVLLYRGGRVEAAEIAHEVLPRARGIGDSQIVVPALSLAALVEDDAPKVAELVEELLGFETTDNPLYPDVARVCARHERLDIAERMMRTDSRASTRARHVGATVKAILAEARGERDEAIRLYNEAAERWVEYPFALERGLCLLAAGRVDEASRILHSLGAESLLAAA